jgi:hypothetical protein
VLAQRERHILEYVLVGEQRAVLKQHAHAPAQRIQLRAAQVADVDAVEQHLALVGPHLPGDQLEERRLAGAARPHDGRDAAACDLQVQPGEDRAPADRIVNIANFDYRVLRCLGISLAARCARRHSMFPIALSERRAAQAASCSSFAL